MRFYLISIIAKTIHKLSKLLNKGSGYTLPGYVGLKLYPNLLLNKNIRFNKGLILISGTNGKTTTTKLISHILDSNGFSVLTNKTGANILNGIVSSILIDYRVNKPYDYGVFEVDEFTLPVLLKYFNPNIIVLLNLSRDQLDRYGETDIILEKWEKVFKNKTNCVYIVDKDESDIIEVVKKVNPKNTFVFDDDNSFRNLTPLKGKFNSKNVNAAVMVCMSLGLNEDQVVGVLHKTDFAYGRGESISYKGVDFHIYLAKNPASFNNNLLALDEFESTSTAIIFSLNDNIPDGRDVSWIYDIDRNLIKAFCSAYLNNIFVTGTRAYDMAIRLKYAEIDVLDEYIIFDKKEVIKRIVDSKKHTNVIVLPNYSSMLEFRKLLVGKKIL